MGFLWTCYTGFRFLEMEMYKVAGTRVPSIIIPFQGAPILPLVAAAWVQAEVSVPAPSQAGRALGNQVDLEFRGFKDEEVLELQALLGTRKDTIERLLGQPHDYAPHRNKCTNKMVGPAEGFPEPNPETLDPSALSIALEVICQQQQALVATNSESRNGDEQTQPASHSSAASPSPKTLEVEMEDGEVDTVSRVDFTNVEQQTECIQKGPCSESGSIPANTVSSNLGAESESDESADLTLSSSSSSCGDNDNDLYYYFSEEDTAEYEMGMLPPSSHDDPFSFENSTALKDSVHIQYPTNDSNISGSSVKSKTPLDRPFIISDMLRSGRLDAALMKFLTLENEQRHAEVLQTMEEQHIKDVEKDRQFRLEERKGMFGDRSLRSTSIKPPNLQCFVCRKFSYLKSPLAVVVQSYICKPCLRKPQTSGQTSRSANGQRSENTIQEDEGKTPDLPVSHDCQLHSPKTCHLIENNLSEVINKLPTR